ncbi:hypothetical protein ACJIZ3_016170 [Penstemon smallii]|uniref:Uncharacterized protein n=1 Tax=Penstemon smallii TaxID=265156 RepID=A0ABD3RPL5_9LAMI
MATSTKRITVHDHCRVAPLASADLVAEQSLPLTYFDIIWLNFHPIQRLLFYQFPCSSAQFLEKIVPNLKKSLSQTLKHHLPLAGSFYFPLNSGMPEFRYVSGDSVSFTIAETSTSTSTHDFNYLIGNQARDADQFYPFVPSLPEPRTDSESAFKIFPLLAVQVTLFPETGICIGFSNDHTVGDASSIVRFIKAWSSATKLGEEEAKISSLPFYDRSVIEDPSGRRANIYWNQMKHSKYWPQQTYILLKEDIQRLRSHVLTKRPNVSHLSSFTISTAYVWSCLAKTAAKIGEMVDDNEPEYYVITVDARHRLDPPVPATYFGNCLAAAVTESTHGELKGEDGFLVAVELISELISKRVNNKEETMRGADDWMAKYAPLFEKRVFGVAGSPKFDLYDTDFGWGKPSKYEAVSIDGDSAMSLCKSREFEGGLEIGLSLFKPKQDAFEAIFNEELKI